MGGGVMQMVKSSEDNYLIGNPKITFFKIVYHRHSNFAMENVEIALRIPLVSYNEFTTTTIIPKSGDLLHNLYYDIKLTGTASNGSDTYINWTNCTGYAYLKEVSIEIEGQQIDKHYSEWFDIWNELTDINLNEHILVNKHNAKNTYLLGNTEKTPPVLQMYIPLRFWFTRNSGLALPLISLQNTDVKMKTTFRKLDHLINCDGGNTDTSPQTNPPIISLYGNYIYLDTDERRKFATDSHDYLIEQVQYLNPQTLSTKHNLNFTNHVKEIIWVCRNKNIGETDYTTGLADATNNIEGAAFSNGNDYFNYSSYSDKNKEYINTQESYEPFETAKIVFEGSDRFTAKKASYFRTLQPLYYHSKVPEKHIYSYSFALRPEEYQPSGFINFSKLNNADLILTGEISDTDILIFATNYNVLRFSGGTAGLAYIS
tara:strand:- start:23 stop:1309 length:1287 start_codon:yes stop_codon:yes gene_type:complete